ncbi:MAG: hypothetical protein IJ933_06810, partial [Bacteroidales bacterium]|nr:hypothetical protein [Bacteroidales bacterium]
KELWLRYLTEIDESTQSVDAALTDNPEISEALKIVQRSAYSDGDLYKYNDYRLEIMTQRNAMMRERSEGRAEGRAEALLETARNLKAMGLPVEQIVAATKLSPDEIAAL